MIDTTAEYSFMCMTLYLTVKSKKDNEFISGNYLVKFSILIEFYFCSIIGMMQHKKNKNKKSCELLTLIQLSLVLHYYTRKLKCTMHSTIN